MEVVVHNLKQENESKSNFVLEHEPMDVKEHDECLLIKQELDNKIYIQEINEEVILKFEPDKNDIKNEEVCIKDLAGSATTKITKTTELSAANTSTYCCTVCYLLKNKFSTLTVMEKLEIIEKGRQKPTLNNLKTKSKTCNRNFKVEFYEQCEWLTGCETFTKLFCWCCLLFTDNSGVWNKSGFCDLHNIHQSIKNHNMYQPHLQAVIKEKMFGKTPLIERTIVDDKLTIISNRKHNELVEKNRATLKSLINVVCFLVMHDLGAVTSTNNRNENFIDLVTLLSNYDVTLKNYLDQSNEFQEGSNRIQNYLIFAISTVVLQKIKSDIKTTRFVTIVLNETNIINQLSVVVRYVINGNVQERFVKFLDLSTKDRTVDLLYNKIISNVIADLKIGEKQLVAQSYDGAVIPTRHLGGLQIKVKQTFLSALFVHHSFTHRLNLILSQSLAHIKECKIFFTTLSGLTDFFLKSPKRVQTLLNLKVMQKKFNYNGQFIQTMQENRSTLIECFENILENCSEWDDETLMYSKSYLEYLKMDFNCNFLLNVFVDIFPSSDKLFDTLQKNLNSDIDIETCVKKITEFKTIIISTRSNFKVIWEKTVNNLVDIDLEPQRKRLRTDATTTTYYRKLLFEIIDQISEQINKRFESFKDLKFLELCKFNEFKKQPFPETAFKALLLHYGQSFDMPALRSQLTVLYASEEIHSKNPSELMNFLKQTGLHKAYCEVLKLCELVLTIPATSACVKDSFSVLKRVDNFVRDSKGQCTLPKLALLSIEKDLLKQLSDNPNFYDNVIEEFAKKDKRIELHYR